MPKDKLEKQISCYNLNLKDFARVEKRIVKKLVKDKLDDGTYSEREKEVEEEKLVLEGYPIVFNTTTHIGGEDWGWDERIDPQALEGADINDCCLKYNHESASPVMARIRNGSLTLKSDNHGVFMHAELLEDDRSFYNRVKAGLIDQMSFAFTIKEQDINYDGKFPLATVKKIDRLFDVALVDNGAYPTTSINARSKEMAEAKSLIDAEAEKRALKAVETANRLEEEKKFEFRKKKEIEKLKLGGQWNE